ncbi:hypothetical protein C1645_840146 [Glomus cerebriforme]|uniref:Uncharacterized protein n=1 Tax=Glomus cerebriforme TaxID=658196 RepID=A0A397S2G9_9GLOM|nr:hypothetical protein C1645_840146 [Glomus cerebriforme]
MLNEFIAAEVTEKVILQMNLFSKKNSIIIINNTRIYHNKALVELVKEVGKKFKRYRDFAKVCDDLDLKKTNVGDKERQYICKACVKVLKRIHKHLANSFFYWLNLKLKLFDRKQLSDPILNQAIDNIENIRKEKLNQVHEQAEILVWKAINIIITVISDSAANLQHMLQYVGKIFKESSILKNTFINAIKLVLYFNHPNNIYFIEKLRTIQKELYSKYYAIIKPGDTKWNSYYDCYKSLIQTKQTLRNLVTRYEIPDKVSSFITELYLSANIC